MRIWQLSGLPVLDVSKLLPSSKRARPRDHPTGQATRRATRTQPSRPVRHARVTTDARARKADCCCLPCAIVAGRKGGKRGRKRGTWELTQQQGASGKVTRGWHRKGPQFPLLFLLSLRGAGLLCGETRAGCAARVFVCATTYQPARSVLLGRRGLGWERVGL